MESSYSARGRIGLAMQERVGGIGEGAERPGGFEAGLAEGIGCENLKRRQRAESVRPLSAAEANDQKSDAPGRSSSSCISFWRAWFSSWRTRSRVRPRFSPTSRRVIGS